MSHSQHKICARFCPSFAALLYTTSLSPSRLAPDERKRCVGEGDDSNSNSAAFSYLGLVPSTSIDGKTRRITGLEKRDLDREIKREAAGTRGRERAGGRTQPGYAFAHRNMQLSSLHLSDTFVPAMRQQWWISFRRTPPLEKEPRMPFPIPPAGSTEENIDIRSAGCVQSRRRRRHNIVRPPSAEQPEFPLPQKYPSSTIEGVFSSTPSNIPCRTCDLEPNNTRSARVAIKPPNAALERIASPR